MPPPPRAPATAAATEQSRVFSLPPRSDRSRTATCCTVCSFTFYDPYWRGDTSVHARRTILCCCGPRTRAVYAIGAQRRTPAFEDAACNFDLYPSIGRRAVGKHEVTKMRREHSD
jgi:hypothetical protein